MLTAISAVQAADEQKRLVGAAAGINDLDGLEIMRLREAVVRAGGGAQSVQELRIAWG